MNAKRQCSKMRGTKFTQNENARQKRYYSLKKDFLSVYKKLPSKEKHCICIVIEDEPMSWNVVHIEVKWKITCFGGKALRQLKNLGLI